MAKIGASLGAIFALLLSFVYRFIGINGSEFFFYFPLSNIGSIDAIIHSFYWFANFVVYAAIFGAIGAFLDVFLSTFMHK